MRIEDEVVAVVGLGYVGLPLAVEFGKQFRTIGFDLSEEKVRAYREGFDPSGELAPEEISASTRIEYHSEPEALKDATFIIVAVPTPVDAARQPDLSPLVGSSKTVGKYLKKGAVVVFESTVFPGATEEICVPELEAASGLKWGEDFSVGYSPERINPGDKEHTVTKILKVVSGDNPETAARVSRVYRAVIKAGVYEASSIAVAEAAKVIENTQRDLNIALMNELSTIFHRMGIDTTDVLEAAGTKWNFLPFRPGLVGGHCIGVDPYYLTHKAEKLGLHPQVIRAGRRINDSMSAFVAQQTVKELIAQQKPVNGCKVAVLGLTFKEACGDLRNSKVADLVAELAEFGVDVYVHDPLASAAEAKHEYGITLHDWADLPKVEAVVLAVAHPQYLEMPLSSLLERLSEDGPVIDVKSVLDRDAVSKLGHPLWRL